MESQKAKEEAIEKLTGNIQDKKKKMSQIQKELEDYEKSIKEMENRIVEINNMNPTATCDAFVIDIIYIEPKSDRMWTRNWHSECECEEKNESVSDGNETYKIDPVRYYYTDFFKAKYAKLEFISFNIKPNVSCIISRLQFNEIDREKYIWDIPIKSPITQEEEYYYVLKGLEIHLDDYERNYIKNAEEPSNKTRVIFSYKIIDIRSARFVLRKLEYDAFKEPNLVILLETVNRSIYDIKEEKKIEPDNVEKIINDVNYKINNYIEQKREIAFQEKKKRKQIDPLS